MSEYINMLSEDEKLARQGVYGEHKTVYRIRLKTSYPVDLQRVAQGAEEDHNHTEACRKRMEGLMKETGDGQADNRQGE